MIITLPEALRGYNLFFHVDHLTPVAHRRWNYTRNLELTVLEHIFPTNGLHIECSEGISHPTVPGYPLGPIYDCRFSVVKLQ